MPSPTQITDHLERAKETTRSQFHESPILQGLLAAIVTEVQRVEDVTFLVITDRDLDNADGVNLDLIGKIVGRARLGVATDAEYRAVLKVQIRANQSDCGADDIIWIASELTGVAVHYWQEGRAHYHLEYITATPLTDAELDRLNELLEFVTCSGVSYEMVEGDDPNAFAFDAGGLGFDEGEFAKLAGQYP